MTYLGLFFLQAALWTTISTFPTAEPLDGDGQEHQTVRLICRPGRPERSWRGWQETPGYHAYSSLDDLCRFKGFEGDRRKTMGCMCQRTGPNGASQQICPRDLADPEIYDNEVLRYLCHTFCRCPLTRPEDGEYPFTEKMVLTDAESASSTTEDSRDTASSENREPFVPALIDNLQESCLASGSGECGNNRIIDRLDFPSSPQLYPSATSESSLKVCGLGCDQYQCAGRLSGCRCMAHPILNTRKYSATCRVIPYQKRDEFGQPVLACPCNGTYITRACCDVDNGIVHEDSSQNLGSMIDEKDVYDLAVEAYSLLRDSLFPAPQQPTRPVRETPIRNTLRTRSEFSLPRLECRKDLPISVPLPYRSLTDLCGTQSQAATVECHCSVDGRGSGLSCSASLASPYLHNLPLLALCQSECFCSAGPESSMTESVTVPVENEAFGDSGILKEEAAHIAPEGLGWSLDFKGDLELKKRNITAEAEKSEHGQGLGGTNDQITPHSHIEQTILSVGCLLLGVTLSIVGSALSWQEKGLRDRNDFS